MEELGSNVRLVRCPRCEKLLHELPDYCIYQCGGCGSVLRANKNGTASDGLSDKSDDERDRGIFEKGSGVSLDSASEIESNGHRLCREKEGALPEKSANSISGPSLGTEVREGVNGFDRNTRREAMDLLLNRSNGNKDYEDEHRLYPKRPISNCVHGNDHETKVDVKRSEHVTLRMENEFEERRPPIENVTGSLRSRPIMEMYLDQGTSNYRPPFPHYTEQEKIDNKFGGPSRVENLESDRLELLRKLDELKDQLSRSCDMAGKPLAQEKHTITPLYFNHSHSHSRVPYRYSHGLDVQGLYPPPRNVPNEFLVHEDPHLHPVLRRGPYQPPYHNHFHRHHVDFNQSTVASHQYETYIHHPSCSCLNCYNKNCQISPNIPTYDPTNPFFNHHASPTTYGPWGSSSRGANPLQLSSRDRKPWIRSTSDLDSDNGGIGHHRPRREVVAHASRKICHPIACGAPFATCSNCFELLKLPRKLVGSEKNRRMVQCGACSTTILFELGQSSLRVSMPVQLKQVSAKVDDVSGDTSNENVQISHGSSNPGAMTSYEDSDDSGYKFQLTYSESNYLSKHDTHSSSPSFSNNEQSPDSVVVRKDVSTSLLKNVSSNGRSNSGVSQDSSFNGSLTTGGVSQDYVEVSNEDEILDTGLSQDYVEVKKEDPPRIDKTSQSFFTGIKKSFKDFSRFGQTGRSNVYVNGQPIPDRVVKKAEKLAGPIQPGEYWYDVRAGFWGVMGQPCLGVIPPFIEEFNYPMPENCADGNTGVFVNGRELHQKDLDLLAGRGLPTTKDKSYLIEISGTVFDEDTREELDNLGKLAPTVERANHGFGMKIPRALALTHSSLQ